MKKKLSKKKLQLKAQPVVDLIQWKTADIEPSSPMSTPAIDAVRTIEKELVEISLKMQVVMRNVMEMKELTNQHESMIRQLARAVIAMERAYVDRTTPAPRS